MSRPLEDYALIGNGQTAGLISRDGSLDWLCWPRFDSAACFAALLGTRENGYWQIGPASRATAQRRAYRDGGLILDSWFATEHGEIVLTDCLVVEATRRVLVRSIDGLSGHVTVRSDFAPRAGYGTIPMTLRVTESAVNANCADVRLMLVAQSPDRQVRFALEGGSARTEFGIGPGERVSFVLMHGLAGESFDVPHPGAGAELEITREFWSAWSTSNRVASVATSMTRRSVTILKALAHVAGGIVAAPTTSLPQSIGGVRNWDYRYCWLRDGALMASTLARTDHLSEAVAWRRWLMQTAAPDVARWQSIYGLSGERDLRETEIAGLQGYDGSRPVRIGNAAYEQQQLDALGWAMVALSDIRANEQHTEPLAWTFERQLADHVSRVWRLPDHGVWEVRGAPRHFTDSKVMAWVALDRAVRSAERWSLDAPIERWRATRDEIHAEVCQRSYNSALGTFVQSYESDLLDSNLLTIPLMGFLPAQDPRVTRTIEAIERSLVEDGLLMRYDRRVDDGLPPGQGAFLPCTFWLVECLAMLGRREEARRLFDRLVSLANDLGLLSEQYDARAQRLTGNFPQGFTHAALVNAALRL